MNKGLDTSSRKDRVLQTRVPAGLVALLQEEARRRRVSVSHLVRGLLEETFELAQAFVSDPAPLAERALRLALAARPAPGSPGSVTDVIAWQEVVLNREMACSECAQTIERGGRGLKSLSEGPPSQALWLCRGCAKKLQHPAPL